MRPAISVPVTFKLAPAEKNSKIPLAYDASTPALVSVTAAATSAKLVAVVIPVTGIPTVSPSKNKLKSYVPAVHDAVFPALAVIVG